MPTFDAILNALRYQREGLLPSPLYALLLEVVIDDTLHGGICADVFAHTPDEVGRCASLLPGFLTVANVTGRPLRILEVGTSAGLNLRWDHYRYEGGAAGTTWGDPDSPLRFDGVFDEPRPRLDVDAHVVER